MEDYKSCLPIGAKMDLVAIGKYISKLESNNIEHIKKLNFLGFNLWKLYRNYFCGKHYSKLQTKNKNTQYINKCIFSLFGFAKNNQNKFVLRVTSASYTTMVENKYYSKRLEVLKQAIESNGYDTAIIGSISIDKIDKTNPRIELNFDSSINYFSPKFRYLMLIFSLFNTIQHYKLLQKVESISFKNIWNIQATFLAKYFLYKLFYKLAKPKKVFFTFASYGCEAEIAALKSLNIEVLEYQHGHLYSEHYGYNYHQDLKPLKHKLLLPDKLFVYGNYWKEVLIKIGFFEDAELVVSGNPSFENIKAISLDKNVKIPILVCSQPNSAHLFRQFIENYMKNSEFKDEYYWIVKLHPREVLGEWEEFVKDKEHIEVSSKDTYELLKSVDIQLSSSSTTLYEALYFGVSNYIILNDLKINESENFDENIGKIIELDWTGEFEKFENGDGKKYFEDFDLEKIL